MLENVSDHGVDKGRLSSGYKESPAKALEEEKHAGRGSEVLGVGQCLNCNHGDLKGAAPASSGDDLVTNPLASRCVYAHCVQEASSDCGNGCASEEERLVPASGSDQDTACNGREGDGNDEGQVTDTAHGWVGAVDRLEVDGDVVDGGEEATSLNKGDQRHDEVGALGKQLRRHHGVLALEPLDKCPSSDDEGESNEKANDDGRVPGVSDATVLDSQDEGDGGSHHQNNTERVHLSNLLNKGRLDGDRISRSLEEDEDDGGRDTSDRQVDVEAPSPGDVVGKGSSQQRSDDTGETIRSTDDARKRRTLLRRCGKGNDGVRTGTETSGAETSDGSAGDEGFGVGGGAADDGAEFEDEDGDEEAGLEREVLINLSPCDEVSMMNIFPSGYGDGGEDDLHVD